MPRNTKKHPQIESDRVPRTRSYKDKDLSNALRRNARTSIKFRLSKKQLRFMRCPVASHHGSTRKLHNILMQWFYIFDTAFFFNGLAAKVNLPLRIYAAHDDGLLGFWLPRPPYVLFAPGRNTIHINAAKQDAEQAVGTLLHEMLHGFLDLYSCICSNCRKNQSSLRGGRGSSAHGAPLLNAMQVLEDALQRQVHWNVDCGVQEAAILEMKSARWQPREEQFQRWDMHPVDVDQLSEASDLDIGGRVLICSVM